MNTIKQLLYWTAATFILFACENKPEAVEQESGLFEITGQQFSTDAMQLGKMETKTFESTVKCNGSVVPLANGMAKVNAPVSGVIKNIYFRHGQFVEKNQALLEISGNEIIDIQKEFAETAAQYKRLESEYVRIKSLYDEKVTSEKDFITIESEFKALMARYNGLKIKIESLGFSISKIENGEFYSSYIVKAPLKGYISSLKATIGSYIDVQSELMDIINPAMFQVKLLLFASDMANLKTGQTVRFKSVNSNSVNFATLHSIGVAMDQDSKSIECYASISDTKQINPIANDFVEAEIITSTDTLMALSSNAIIKDEAGSFILVLNKQEEGRYLFDKVEVKTGRQHEGFIEIIEPKLDGLILTQGLYNIAL